LFLRSLFIDHELPVARGEITALMRTYLGFAACASAGTSHTTLGIRTVGRVFALRDDAFEAKLAGVGEDGRAVALDMLVEADGWAGPWPR
jgi:hypothetical protein